MIARYPNLLEIWLYTLTGQTDQIPPHMKLALLPLADKQAIDQRLQQALHSSSKCYKKHGHLMLIDYFIGGIMHVSYRIVTKFS